MLHKINPFYKINILEYLVNNILLSVDSFILNFHNIMFALANKQWYTNKDAK